MKTIKNIIKIVLLLGIIGTIALTTINIYMVNNVKNNILTIDELKSLDDVDCVLVLGCGVDRNGNPSKMLSDRIDAGIEAYNNCDTNRIIMSGDHGRVDYDEVNIMKSIAVLNGIESDNIFCDHAGFSTYESMYRAIDIFGAKKIVIITQEYHLTRAIYDAKKLGLEAYGVKADRKVYGGQIFRDIREVLARGKDFIWCIIKPEPTYRGDKIPLDLSGSKTDG